jgi:Putative citrate transport
MILPFGLLLAGMALGPLLLGQWWGRHYGKAAAALAGVTVGYYPLFLPSAAALTVARAAHDYFCFWGSLPR